MNLKYIQSKLKGLQSSDPEVRLQTLKGLNDDDLNVIPVENLLPLLTDEDEAIRFLTIWALAELNDISAIPALLGAAADPNDEVAGAARAALVEFRTRDAVDPLTAGVAHRFPAVRAAAVAALREHRDQRAIPALRAALEDASAEVRREAVIAFVLIPDSGALSALRWIFYDSDMEVRRAIVTALGAARDHAALPYLVRALRDHDWEVRHDAAIALRQFPNPENGTLVALRRALRDGHPQVVSEAIASLGELRAPVAADVAEFLTAGDSGLRAAAARALGEIGDPSVQPRLTALLTQPDRTVTDAAWRALERLSGSVAKAA